MRKFNFIVFSFILLITLLIPTETLAEEQSSTNILYFNSYHQV